MRLYKIMKDEYYLKALKFGDLCFASPHYASSNDSYNADRNEKDTSIILCEGIDGKTRYKESISRPSFSYCFTMNKDMYLGKYDLRNDEVVLGFELDDILDFFESLAIYIVAYGKVAYGSDEPDITIKEVLKGKRDDDEQFCKQAFIKDKDFELECEYRFVCIPRTVEYLMYYNPDTNTQYGYGGECRYCNGNLYIKLSPLVRIDGKPKYISDSVVELFKKAEVII